MDYQSNPDLVRGNKFQSTFREFSQDYFNAQTPTGNYKPTLIFHNLADINNIPESTKNSLFKFEPNTKIYGNTWDAQHMDNFLNTSKWGCGIKYLAISPNSIRPPLQKKLKASLSEDKTKLGNSYFFNHGRTDEQYVVNDFCHKLPENKFNELVCHPEMKVAGEDVKSYFDQNFKRREKKFDPLKLCYTENDKTNVNLPHIKRAELEEMKQQRKLYDEWKQKNMEITKKQRIIKGGYSQGITGFDNPLLENTYTYKEEREKLDNYLHEQQKIQERHKNDLLKYTRTNPEVIFHNKFGNELELNGELKKVLNKPIVKLNTRKPIKEEFVMKSLNTHNRLFGSEVEKYSLQRAAFLREKELRGKTNDIVSGVLNHIQLKADIINPG